MSSMKCVFELDTKRCVLDAIDAGYRSIDTAQAYIITRKVLEKHWQNPVFHGKSFS